MQSLLLTKQVLYEISDMFCSTTVGFRRGVSEKREVFKVKSVKVKSYCCKYENEVCSL